MYDTCHSDGIGFRGRVIGGTAKCPEVFTSDRILSRIDCLHSYRCFDHAYEGTIIFRKDVTHLPVETA